MELKVRYLIMWNVDNKVVDKPMHIYPLYAIRKLSLTINWYININKWNLAKFKYMTYPSGNGSKEKI